MSLGGEQLTTAVTYSFNSSGNELSFGGVVVTLKELFQTGPIPSSGFHRKGLAMNGCNLHRPTELTTFRACEKFGPASPWGIAALHCSKAYGLKAH